MEGQILMMEAVQMPVNLFLLISFFCFCIQKIRKIVFILCFKLFGFSFVEVLRCRINQAAKEGCSFLKDVVDLMDRLTQGDNLTPDEMEIISYHLDVARNTQFVDVTEDSQNSNEFQMKTQPMVSQFLYTLTPNTINPYLWIFIT